MKIYTKGSYKNKPHLTSIVHTLWEGDPGNSWYITDLQCKPQTKFVNFHKRVNKGGRIGWTPLYTFSGNAHLMEFCADKHSIPNELQILRKQLTETSNPVLIVLK